MKQTSSVENPVCLGCACCCVGSKWIDPCELAKTWFSSNQSHGQNCFIDGENCLLEEALDHSVELIRNSLAPHVCGFADLNCESQRATIKFARQINATIDWTNSPTQIESILAFQQGSHITCSYGEIKDRADLVIIWNFNIDQTNPQFLNRFVSENVRVLKIDEPNRANLISEALLSIEKTALHSVPKANYCVFVINSAVTNIDRVERMQIDELIVRLNESAQVRLIDLAGNGNARGASEVSTWLSGYPTAVRFLQKEQAEYDPHRFRTDHVFETCSSDLNIFVGGDIHSSLNGDGKKHLEKTPLIMIGHKADDYVDFGGVMIQTPFDLMTAGTVFRPDGVTIEIESSPVENRALDIIQLLESKLQRSTTASESQR